MKPTLIDRSYSVQVWNHKHYPNQWIFMDQRNSVEDARIRRDELRKRFKRVRIVRRDWTETVIV